MELVEDTTPATFQDTMMKRRLPAVLLFARILVSLVVVLPATQALLIFRDGRKSDELTIASTLAKELMNPLGVRGDRFVVADDDDDDNNSNNKHRLVGWAQIKPLGAQKSSRDKVDPEIEKDALKVGWGSLPKEFAAAGKKRRGKVLEGEKKQKLESTNDMLWELSSVYVDPSYRGQGIGTDLVRRVLERHVQRGLSTSNVYLLTLATTVQWYQDSFGFEVVPKPQVPEQLAFEVSAGTLITKLIGEELCCMRGPQRSSSKKGRR